MSPSAMCDTSTATTDVLTAPSSWIDVQWISRDDLLQETSPTTSPETLSIASFSTELNELKSQLMPAATSCANAINAYNEQLGSKDRTNPSYEFRCARSMCNQYEALGAPHYNQIRGKKRARCPARDDISGVNQFVNRSALKLANIDAILGFSLVKHRGALIDDRASSITEGASYFSFVDLCGAPGGFSEYILYRHKHPVTCSDNGNFTNDIHSESSSSSTVNKESKKVQCFGFGMSLIGSNEDGKGVHWNLNHLRRYHGSKRKKRKAQLNVSDDTDRHLHYSVCNGSDGTGSIYNWDNVLHLRRKIQSTLEKNLEGSWNDGLVHLVVADGGFDAQRDLSSQEERAHRIIVSQTAAALQLLHIGGHFVVKMFGFELDRTKKMLLYLQSKFNKLVLIKPIISRPASAERYLVCLDFAGCHKNWDGLTWIDHMMRENVHQMDSLVQSSVLLSKLNGLLYSFDVKMLQLNAESCRSIVHYLEERTSEHVKGAEADKQSKQKGRIDLISYGQCWHLN